MCPAGSMERLALAGGAGVYLAAWRVLSRGGKDTGEVPARGVRARLWGTVSHRRPEAWVPGGRDRAFGGEFEGCRRAGWEMSMVEATAG